MGFRKILSSGFRKIFSSSFWVHLGSPFWVHSAVPIVYWILDRLTGLARVRCARELPRASGLGLSLMPMLQEAANNESIRCVLGNMQLPSLRTTLIRSNQKYYYTRNINYYITV
eukprot:2497812-Amphidinium_carterae.1